MQTASIFSFSFALIFQLSGKDSFIKDLVKSLDHTQLGLRPELVVFFGLFKADKLPLPLEIVLQEVEEHVEKEIKKKDVLIERAKQNEELMRSLQDQVKSLKENLETKDKRIER